MTSQDGVEGSEQRRLEQADRIFARALEQEDGAREAYVARACAGDEALRRMVDDLIRSAHGTDSLIRSGGAFRSFLEDGPGDDVLAGRTVLEGRYRILRELGRGGMGVVYLAERADGHFEQRVALKVIHRGAGRQAAARFLRERQILAGLVHPKIVRLLDGGIGPSGHPYLVMDHVEGRPIDRYCAEEGVGFERRLELLADVCEAVQVAHQQLVVHRDLKPSNVLVTDSGEVMLLDFGIAKLLGDATEGGLGVVETGDRVMTPQYASPEQYRGEAITVASDVYQLGFLAYELLSGRRPYELADASPGETERRICVDPPPRPSAAADGEEARRRLEGDLDAIVRKALHKDPARRYRSADQLREDVARHLAGRPVLARPDDARYRLGKFLGRHRWEVSVAAAGLALLLFLSATFTLRLASERDRTRAQAAAAEEQRRRAEEVVGFLMGLFNASNPMVSSGETMTVREILDRGAARIEHRLAGQPATQARLMLTIGQIYHDLGNYERARELARASLDLRRQAPERPDLELADSLDALARVEMVVGDPEESFRLLEEAFDLRSAALPAADPLVARTLHLLAASRYYQGRWAEGEALQRRAVELARAAGRPTRELAMYLGGLANALDEQGRVQEARRLYRESLAVEGPEFGPWHPTRAAILSNLAASYARSGDHTAAGPLLERAIEIQERAFGTDHPHWAIMMGNLGTSYRELGRLDEAEAAYLRALELRRRVYGEEHPEVARSLVDLGNLSLARDAPALAEDRLRRAVAIEEASLAADHPFRGVTLTALGRALRALARGGEAGAALGQAVEILEAVNGASHVSVAEPLSLLGELQRRRGDRETAERLLRRVVEILEGAEDARPDDLRRAREAHAELVGRPR